MKDIYLQKLKDQQLQDMFAQEQDVPLFPDVQGLPEGAPMDVPQVAADQANQIVQADNAPQEPSPEMGMEGVDQAMQAAQQVDVAQLPGANEPASPPVITPPVKEPTDMEKLLAQYEASKAEAGDRRGQAQMLDAFEQMNRSLAGRAGNKIEKGPTNVSQLPKDTNLQELMAKYKMLSGDKALKLKGKEIESKKEEKRKTHAEKILREDKKAEIAQEQLNIKKDKEKRSASDASNKLNEELQLAKSRVGNIEGLKKELKEGGVTGIWDAGPAAWIDSMIGSKDATTRKNLQEMAVDQTLLKTAQTKGAISDAEMALFKSPIPSDYADEKIWIEWLDKVKTAQQDIIKRLDTGDKASQDNSSDIKESEVRRKTKDGKIAIYNKDSKEFLRYE